MAEAATGQGPAVDGISTPGGAENMHTPAQKKTKTPINSDSSAEIDCTMQTVLAHAFAGEGALPDKPPSAEGDWRLRAEVSRVGKKIN